eukprot:7389761-Prymnesium_polylepis.2
MRGRYRPEVYYWEAVSLGQRLLLTGYACLIPNSLGVVRTIIGLFVSVIFSSLMIVVQPYRRFDLNSLATASSLIQTCGFFAAVRSARFAPRPCSHHCLTQAYELLPLSAQLLIKLHDDLVFYWTDEGTYKVLGYTATTDLAVLLAVFCFCFLFAVLVVMRRTSGASFRATIRLLSHDDGSIAPKVTFVTDIEGNWLGVL